jgi:hypothetical protein
MIETPRRPELGARTGLGPFDSTRAIKPAGIGLGLAMALDNRSTNRGARRREMHAHEVSA